MRFALKRAWYFLIDNWSVWIAVVLGALVFWFVIKPAVEGFIKVLAE